MSRPLEAVEVVRGRQHGQEVRHAVRRVVRARVLLEVVLAAEALAARGAREGPQPRVDALVAGQLLVAGEALAAALLLALERPLTWGTQQARRSGTFSDGTDFKLPHTPREKRFANTTPNSMTTV